MSVKVTDQKNVKQAAGASFGLGLQFLAFADFLLLGLWLGSMAFFSFVLAPSAFAALPTRHLAGLIVGSTLIKLEMIGLVLGSLLLLVQLIKTWALSASSKLNFVFLIMMLLTTAALRFWISPSMNILRQAMNGEIDSLPSTDPARIQFNELHQYSVNLMAVTILSGLALLFFTVRSWLASSRQRRES
jgi:hypothetical protein